jgi:hypothetical protein
MENLENKHLKRDKKANEGKSYLKPRLIKLGNVQDLTKHGGSICKVDVGKHSGTRFYG